MTTRTTPQFPAAQLLALAAACTLSVVLTGCRSTRSDEASLASQTPSPTAADATTSGDDAAMLAAAAAATQKARAETTGTPPTANPAIPNGTQLSLGDLAADTPPPAQGATRPTATRATGTAPNTNGSPATTGLPSVGDLANAAPPTAAPPTAAMPTAAMPAASGPSSAGPSSAGTVHPASATSSSTTDNPSEPPVRLASAAKNALGAFRLGSNLWPGGKQADSLQAEVAAFKSFPFDFQLPTVDGKPVDSRQLGASLLIVDIWATWCGPCRKAIPEFIEMQSQYGSFGVQVVGITCDSKDPAKQAAAVPAAQAIGKQLGVNYPILMDDGTTTDKIPGFRSYPTTLFVTPDGQVRYMAVGVQSQERMAAILQALLATRPSQP